MEPFNVYNEKFSLNPRDWFKTPEKDQLLKDTDDKIRTEVRKDVHTNIRKLKYVLKEMGYVVHKHDFAYHLKKDRKIGISKSDIYEKSPQKIPYVKALFTLAHEVGHALQWEPGTDLQYNFKELWAKQLAQSQFIQRGLTDKALEDQIRLYYELDAWVRGMQFIPIRLKAQYKKYAYWSYKTYMHRHPKYYNSDVLLKNLLYKLNFEEHK